MIENDRSDRLLAEALPDGIIVLNSENKIVWYNQVASDLFGIDEVGSTSKHIRDVISHSALNDLLNKKNDNAIEIPAPLDARSRLCVHLRPYHQEHQLLIIKNVTHTYHLEAMRQQFVANVSHELRTPLTVFHGYLDLLISSPQVPVEKLKEIFQQMAGQTERMERLVEDLLLLSKLESVEPDRSKHDYIDVNVLLSEISHQAKVLSDGQHCFSVNVETPMQLRGDQDEIYSAFSNLIFNAVRYTPENGSITISWAMKDNQLMLVVEDNGIGIADKHILRITQRFYRVDQSRLYRGQGGTGLGLAIVKHVALRHHAELVIESQLGVGSIFKLVFNLDD